MRDSALPAVRLHRVGLGGRAGGWKARLLLPTLLLLVAVEHRADVRRDQIVRHLRSARQPSIGRPTERNSAGRVLTPRTDAHASVRHVAAFARFDSVDTNARMVSRAVWYPVRYGIPHGMISRTAWYPTRHDIPHGMVSRTA